MKVDHGHVFVTKLEDCNEKIIITEKIEDVLKWVLPVEGENFRWKIEHKGQCIILPKKNKRVKK